MSRHRLLFVFLLAIAAQAHADAISGPPDNCPAGSRGVSSHSGEWCEASTCRNNSDCTNDPRAGGSVCRRAVGLCVRRETYQPSGRFAPDVPRPTLTRQVALGPCTRASDCQAPARCVKARRCAVPVTRNAIGCSASPGASSPLLLSFLFLISVRALARRGSARP